MIEEIPVWWFDTEAAWNVQNNERHIHEQMFREMVFKDYNRPSIFYGAQQTNVLMCLIEKYLLIESIRT